MKPSICRTSDDQTSSQTAEKIMSSIVCVVPSIRPEQMQEFRKAWSSLFEKHAVTLVTVWDGEVPISEFRSPKQVNDDAVSEQELPRIRHDSHNLLTGPHTDMFCCRTDAVRNLGFVLASTMKTDYIFTADDDVHPPPGSDPIQEHLDVLQRRVPISWMNTAMDQGVTGIDTDEQEYSNRSTQPYLRGFPYGIREEAPVKVSHGVWVSVPDFDGKTQLELGKCGACASLRSEMDLTPTENMKCLKCNGTGYDGSRLPYSLPYFRGPVPKGVYMPFCFTPETEVTMKSGARKQIQDIKPGDEVFAKDGDVHPVIRVMTRQYKGEVVTLKVAGRDRELTATPNHNVMVLRDGITSWIEADHIHPGDMIAAPVVKCQSNMDLTPGSSMAKIIGYWLAEGCFDKYSPNAAHGRAGEACGIAFTFGTEKKQGAIADCKQALDNLGIMWDEHYPKETTTVITTNVDYQLVHRMNVMGVGEYAHGKRLPRNIHLWSKDDQRDLLAAYWAGDGCFNQITRLKGTDQFQCQAKTRSRTMALQLQLLMQSFGFSASVSRLSAYKQSKECWAISLNGEKAKRFKEFLETGRVLEPGKMKNDKAFSDGEYHYYKVKEVTRSLYDGTVYNMTVQDDHSYIAEGLVVKNCGMNVMVHRDALPYLYFAPMGPDTGVEGLNRFADIWMGILLKRAMDDKGWAIYTGASTILHTRASDPFKNVEQERLGVEWNEYAWKKHVWESEEAPDAFRKYWKSYLDKAAQFRDLIRKLQGD